MERPRIAVLLAAYNGMLWIEQQINSILNQEGVNVTIFVSVDPSTDGTEQWCASFSEANANVVVLSAAGTFGGAGKNFYRLIRDVHFNDFDYVAFSDQDDIWLPGKLQRAAAALQAGVFDAYSSNVTAFWSDGATRLLDKAQAQVRWDYLFEAAGPGCTYVLTKALALSLKGILCSKWKDIQSITLHDWFCYGYARANGYQWYIDPEPSVLYRQHSSNQVGANVGLKSLITRYRTIRSGWWFSQVALMVRVLDKTDDVFVRRWIRLGPMQMLYLASQAFLCRRRFRDKFFFFVLCLGGIKGASW